MEVKEKATEICPTTTQKWVANGALLVDVRQKEEVEALAYDVPNIVNIPLSIFEEKYMELPKDRDLVMVCRSGGRSLKATYFLLNHGYTRVVNIQHGLLRWVEKGFPTKGQTAATSSANAGNSCCGSTSTKVASASSCCDAPKSDDRSCC